MNKKLVASLVLIGLAVIFVLQNTATTEIRFLFWTVTMSRALMFIGLLALGLGAGWLLCSHFTRAGMKRRS